MKKKTSLVIILLLLSSHVYAEYILNFYTGTVSVEVNGKSIPYKTGISLPVNAVIITGKNGNAAIFNSSNNTVINVSRNRSISLKTGLKNKEARAQKSVFNKFKHEKYKKTTSISGVRASEQDDTDISWSDEIINSVKNDMSHEWDLFNSGQYDKVISLTSKSENPDGRFLHAASLYFQYGLNSMDEIIVTLESVLKSSAGQELKCEADRIIANIYFETGRYDLSLKHITSAVKFKPDNLIEETSYFILIVSSLYNENDNEAAAYIRKMKKYYPDSQLLNELPE